MARKAVRTSKNNNKNKARVAAAPAKAGSKSKTGTRQKTASKAVRKIAAKAGSIAKAAKGLTVKPAKRGKSESATTTRAARPAKAGVLAAAKAVLSSVTVTAKDAVNLAVATTIANTAAKSVPKAVLKSAPKTAEAPSLQEGAVAASFSLPRDGGGTVSSDDFAGRKLVLFFYPRADTPGCTREAMDFTRLRAAFAAANTDVLGVSADPVKAQDKFRDKHCLGVPLVSDETHELLSAYGVWAKKSMYGKSFMGIVRTTVLVGPDSRIARIWRSVSVDGHADEVLAAARAL